MDSACCRERRHCSIPLFTQEVVGHPRVHCHVTLGMTSLLYACSQKIVVSSRKSPYLRHAWKDVIALCMLAGNDVGINEKPVYVTTIRPIYVTMGKTSLLCVLAKNKTKGLLAMEMEVVYVTTVRPIYVTLGKTSLLYACLEETMKSRRM